MVKVIVHPEVKMLFCLTMGGQGLYLLLGYLATHPYDLAHSGINHGKGVVLPFHQDQFVISEKRILIIETPFFMPVGGWQLVGRSLFLRIFDGEMKGPTILEMGEDG